MRGVLFILCEFAFLLLKQGQRVDEAFICADRYFRSWITVSECLIEVARSVVALTMQNCLSLQGFPVFLQRQRCCLYSSRIHIYFNQPQSQYSRRLQCRTGRLGPQVPGRACSSFATGKGPLIQNAGSQRSENASLIRWSMVRFPPRSSTLEDHLI